MPNDPVPVNAADLPIFQALTAAPTTVGAETEIQRLIREHKEIDRRMPGIDDPPSSIGTSDWETGILKATQLRLALVRAVPRDFEDLRRKAMFAFHLCEGAVDEDIAEDLAENSATNKTLIFAVLRDFVTAFRAKLENPNTAG